METRSHHLDPTVMPTDALPAVSATPNAQAPEVLMRTLENGGVMKSKTTAIVLSVYAILIGLGIFTGFSLARADSATLGATAGKTTVIKTGSVAGITDTQTFKDSAIGVIEKGGIDGEGTHKLIRDGGPSQTAFLISSVIDLDEYLGKKVKVWGQTFAARKAAWLMDVGKVEIQ